MTKVLLRSHRPLRSYTGDPFFDKPAQNVQFTIGLFKIIVIKICTLYYH